MAKPKIEPKVKRLLDDVEQFRRARPWNEVDEQQLFVVELEGQDEALTGMVVGGDAPGLVVVRSADGYRRMLDWLMADDDEVFEAVDNWGVGWEKRHELDSRFTSILNRGGLRGDKNQRVPYLYARDAHHGSRPLRGAEIQALGDVLRGVMACYKSGRLQPPTPPLCLRRTQRLQIAKGGKLVDVSTVRVPIAPSDAPLPAPILLDPGLADLPRLEQTLAIAATLGPPTRDDLSDMVVLFALDIAGGVIVGDEVVFGDPIVELPTFVETTLHGESGSAGSRVGLPRRILFESTRLFTALTPSLAELDIEAVLEPTHAVFERVDELVVTLHALASARLPDRDAPFLPTLQNTDGEPLEVVNARFFVADHDRCVAALEERGDVESTEYEGEWIWQSDENTMLAHLEMIEDCLEVEVNSKARLDRIRGWIDKIPGVAFVRESVREVADPIFDDSLPPRDDPMETSAELPPEITQQVNAMLEQRILGWIDESVPALGGSTPREACATPSGREKVASMIREMNEPVSNLPSGSFDFDRLKEQMLEELGLGDV